MGTAKAKVAWDELTYSKKGGVGLFRIRITGWNEAAVLRLSKFIVDGHWMWPHARSNDLVQIQNTVCEMWLGGEDAVIWLPAQNKIKNCRDTWRAIRAVKHSICHC
uniref:Uncharacterized protein n=1 Tax=Fagus sylvatica TaxID=28930 RepID=A0A2N9J4S4_FAGSY